MNSFLGLAYLLALLVGFVGWVLNIIDIVHTIGGPLTAMFVARLIGVLAFPLGAVLGFCS
jgi:hypothetical protein